ncbi:MAG: radical SAM protein, partial [Nitrospirae bacterium]|nr:radical SAM protein [Nitrospirota bacterium]
MNKNRYILRKERFGGFLFDRNSAALKAVSNDDFELFIKKWEHSVDVIINQELIDNTAIPITAPIKAFLALTDYCNLNCTHCSVDSSSHKKQHLPYKDIELLLRQFVELGIFEIGINGGEPVLHPEFFSIVDLIKYFGFIIHLNTNGVYSAITADRLSKAGIDKIKVSLDGLENSHDTIRGKGTFRKSLQTIEHLLRKGNCVRVNYTMTHENKKDWRGLIKLCDNLGCDIKIAPLIFTGRAKNNLENYKISTSEGRDMCQSIIAMKDNNDLKISVEVTADIVEDDCFKVSQYNYQFGLCGSKIFDISIHNNGMLYCTGHQTDFDSDGPIGNIKDMPIIKLWE